MFEHLKEETMPLWLYNCDPVELAELAYGKHFTVKQAFETYWYLSMCPVARAYGSLFCLNILLRPSARCVMKTGVFL